MNQRASKRINLLLAILTYALFIIRWGYTYLSDSVENVVFIEGLISNHALRDSLTYQMISSEFPVNHRAPFIFLCLPFFYAGAGEHFFFFMHMFCYIVAFFVWFNVCDVIFQHRGIAEGRILHLKVISATLLLFFDGQIPGNSPIYYADFIPSVVSTMFALLSLYLLIKNDYSRSNSHKREIIAGICIGISTIFQAISGTLVFLACIPFVIRKRYFIYTGLWCLTGGIWLFLLYLNAVAFSESDIWLATTYRSAHHYRMESFSGASLITFLIISVMGGISLSKAHSFTKHFMFSTIIILLIYGFITWFFPYSRMVLARGWMLIPYYYAIVIPEISAHFVSREITRFLMWACMLAWGTIIFYKVNRPPAIDTPFLTNQRGLRELAQFIKKNTDTSCVLIVSPALSILEGLAERKLFVNYKAFPYVPELMSRWHFRLLMILGMKDTCCGLSALPWLNLNFYENVRRTGITALKSLGDYLVLEKKFNVEVNSPPLFQNNDFILYSIRQQKNKKQPED